MFTFKKLIANLIAPVPLTLIVLGIAVMMLWSASKRKQTFGKLFATLSFIMLAVFSSPKLPDAVIGNLESKYPSYLGTAANVSHIVVLGCGHNSSDDQPITSELFHCSMARLLEGIRINRIHPEAELVLSGYGGEDPFSNAEMMKRMISALGIYNLRIHIEPKARDTEEEAQLLKKRLVGKPFILVTSASHMPRAMGFFEHHGMRPIAAPTNHIANDYQYTNWWEYIPDSDQLKKSERSFYEWMGLIWQQIKS